MSPYLGLDVGATHLRAAVATADLDIEGFARTDTPRGTNGERLSEDLLSVTVAACEDAGVEPTSIAAVGVGSVGPLDREGGGIVDPANVEVDGRVELAEPLGEFLGTDRITVRRDTVCGVIGERAYAETATEDMVYLTFSTGIGAGVIADGMVILGHHGNAGEVGHMTIDPAGTMTCRCGLDGHWEAYCGGANIPGYAATLHRDHDIETSLPMEDLSTEDLFDAVGRDELADQVVERVGRWNGIGVANVIQAYSPSYVAIGGAVALENPAKVLEPIRREIPRRSMLDPPSVGLTEVGENVVLKGALLLAAGRSPISISGT